MLPDDDASRAEADVYRERGKLLFFYEPYPSIPHWAYSLAANLVGGITIVAVLFTDKTLSDRWMGRRPLTQARMLLPDFSTRGSQASENGCAPFTGRWIAGRTAVAHPLLRQRDDCRWTESLPVRGNCGPPSSIFSPVSSSAMPLLRSFPDLTSATVTSELFGA